MKKFYKGLLLPVFITAVISADTVPSVVAVPKADTGKVDKVQKLFDVSAVVDILGYAGPVLSGAREYVASNNLVQSLTSGDLGQAKEVVKQGLQAIPDSFFGFQLEQLKNGTLSKAEFLANVNNFKKVSDIAIRKLDNPVEFLEQLNTLSSLVPAISGFLDSNTAVMLTEVAGSMQAPLQQATVFAEQHKDTVKKVAAIGKNFLEQTNKSITAIAATLPDSISLADMHKVLSGPVMIQLVSAAGSAATEIMAFVAAHRADILDIVTSLRNNVPSNIQEKVKDAQQAVVEKKESKESLIDKAAGKVFSFFRDI